jgi:hypothetical protein
MTVKKLSNSNTMQNALRDAFCFLPTVLLTHLCKLLCSGRQQHQHQAHLHLPQELCSLRLMGMGGWITLNRLQRGKTVKRTTTV